MQREWMEPSDRAPADSPALDWRVQEGGRIPGAPGVPAFVLRQEVSLPVPVVVAVPHAGRHYPADLLAMLRQPGQASQRLEDRLVDLVGQEVARRTGATLLIAQAPRAMIDLNRAPDDIDREMIAPDALLPDFPPTWRGPMGARRAQGGLGLIPRRLPGLGELWRQRLPAAQAQARIADVHEPYHALLGDVLAQAAQRWGAALLIDLHSMPPLPARGDGELAPTYVVGDRFGAACSARLTGAAFAHLNGLGALAAHNRPYAGGYGLERHARRESGIHALQIEIDRSAYLDAALLEPGEGMEGVIEVITGLVRCLAGEVAALGQTAQRWPRAAE